MESWLDMNEAIMFGILHVADQIVTDLLKQHLYLIFGHLTIELCKVGEHLTYTTSLGVASYDTFFRYNKETYLRPEIRTFISIEMKRPL